MTRERERVKGNCAVGIGGGDDDDDNEENKSIITY